jgi:uncharacterized protein
MPTRDTPWPDGTPCWVDLSTSDPNPAREFYARLLGWDWSEGEEATGFYSNASLGGQLVAGSNGTPVTDSPPTWTTYIAAADVDATADSAVRHGGNLVAPPADVMDLGRLAMLEDAHHGAFGIWQAGKHIGTQRVNETGCLVWTEYMARDYDEAKEFFAAIFSYTYTEIGDSAFQYSTIEVSGNTVGGLGVLAPEMPAEVTPHFRIYFAVENCDVSADHVIQLGGAVLRPPQDMPYGRHADVADPQGAAFSIITPPSGQ